MSRRLLGVSLGWIGISMVADGVASVLLPHQLLATGGGAARLGAGTLVAVGIAALAQPFAGAWSDRAGGGRVIVAGAMTGAFGLGLLALGLPELGGISALLGASVVQAGYQRMLPDRIEPGARGRGAGLKGLFDLAGAFVAFSLLAGVLAVGAVPTAAGILAAGLVGSIGIGLLLLRGRSTQREAIAPSSSDSRGEGRLAWMIAARFLFLLGVYAVGRFLIHFLSDRFALGADEAAAQGGSILAVLALITGLAALPSGWLADRLGRAPLVLGGGLAAGAGIAMLPLAGSASAIVVPGVLMAVGTAAFGAGSWAIVADLAASGSSGRLMGIANLGTAGAAAAAGLFGVLIDLGNGMSHDIGYVVAFGVAAGTSVAGGLIGWRSIARGRSRALREVTI